MSDATPAAGSANNPAPSSPGFEIVFDPFRLVGALLEKHRWIM